MPRKINNHKNPIVIVVGHQQVLFLKNMTNRIPHYKFTCKNCKNLGHASAFCSLRVCKLCKEVGHSSNQCRYRSMVRTSKMHTRPKQKNILNDITSRKAFLA